MVAQKKRRRPWQNETDGVETAKRKNQSTTCHFTASKSNKQSELFYSVVILDAEPLFLK